MNINKYYFVLLFILTFQISVSQEGDQEIPIIKYFTEGRGNINLDIEITDLKSNKGYIEIGLVDSKQNLIVNATSIKISNFKARISLDSIIPGIYAVRFYHDENKNGKLDLNFIGIPKESYGSSNNIKPVLGPPKFEKMLFNLNENKILIINPVN